MDFKPKAWGINYAYSSFVSFAYAKVKSGVINIGIPYVKSIKACMHIDKCLMSLYRI